MSAASEFITPEDFPAFRAQALQLVATHVNANVARIIEAVNEDIFEWSGQGSYFYDAQGRRFFDAATCGGVFALGHAHPKVVNAVCAQAKKGGLSSHAGFVPNHLQLLRRLSEIVPGHHAHGHIGSTGTEATEAALRLARLTTGRPKIVGTESGYHGMSITSLSVTGIPYCHLGTPRENADSIIIPYNDLKAADKALTEEVAAIILEPVQWAAGCRVASVEYLQGLRRLCDERGILLILDEIQTGLGRTGTWFAADRAGIVPDLITVGKALSGGMTPISAVMYGERIHQAEAKIPTFLNSTFAGNPLSCAAALATLDCIQQENLLKRVQELSAAVAAKFDELLKKYPDVVLFHNGLGLMRCLITRSAPFGSMMSALLLKEHGVLLPAMLYNPAILRISPPFNTSDDELAEFFAHLDAVCAQMQALGETGVQKLQTDIQAKAIAALTAPRN